MSARRPFWADQSSIFDAPHAAVLADVDDSKLRAWMADEQAKHADHPAADPECEGCQTWGVCCWHSPPVEPGLAARTVKQAEGWQRAGYEPADVIPLELELESPTAVVTNAR